MEHILISALATACVLSAVEAFLIAVGKWRGFLGILLSPKGRVKRFNTIRTSVYLYRSYLIPISRKDFYWHP